MTLRDIARIAEVSIATASRSLNDSPLIPAETRSRIKRIARAQRFEFNAHARSLVTRRVGTIGIILPADFDRFSVNMYHGTLHNALRDVLEHNDIDLIVAFLKNRFTGRDNVRKLVMRKKVDGLIIVQPAPQGGLVDFLRSAGIPFVFSHYPPQPGSRPDIDQIYPDNELGGYLVGMRFTGLDRRNTLCLSLGGDLDPEYGLRIAGLRRALSEAGARGRLEELAAGDITIDAGHAAVMGARRRIARCDSLFALNDLMAIGAVLALRELGVRIPQDIAVTGYDDTDLAASMKPSLTTIHQPREELSLATCERLIQLIRAHPAGSPRPAGRRIVLPPRLVVRET